jgi:putative intracellular protease/amidase
VNVLVARNHDIVSLGTLAAPLEHYGMSFTTWWAEREPPPPDLRRHDAVIALGGGANPDEDDRYPWLEDERRLLRRAVDEGLPVLGICLGAQLLAQALQYHAEVDADVVTCWLGAYDNQLRGLGVHAGAVLAESRLHMNAYRRHSQALADAFASVTKDRLARITGVPA